MQSVEERAQELRERLTQIFAPLNKDEVNLFKEVLKIERDQLHLKRPRVKDDILSKVKEIIKHVAEDK
jgi:hypothetical protein